MKTQGKIVVMLIVILIAGGILWQWRGKIMPAAPAQQTPTASQLKEDLTKQAAVAATEAANKAISDREAALSAKLLAGTGGVAYATGGVGVPKVSGVSAYKPYTMKDSSGVERQLVKFPLNVWPGWAPIIVANNGMLPNEDSVCYKKYKFFLELVLTDDPVSARNLYASGQVPIGWATLDMVSLFAPGLEADSRTLPVVCQQIDFSNGGDGMVGRPWIKSLNDLRQPHNGQKNKVAFAQSSPSEFFWRSATIDANVNWDDVDIIMLNDAPSAAKLFVSPEGKNIAMFVGWSPDIYNVTDSKIGDPTAHIVVTSHDYNHQIADVWYVRSDFYRDHRDIIANLIRANFEGMDMVRANPTNPAAALAKAFTIPMEDCLAMVGDGMVKSGDAHLCNYAENVKFFLDPNCPYGFESIWNRASMIYNRLGAINTITPASRIKHSELLAGMSGEYKDVKDLSLVAFDRSVVNKSIEANDNEILTKPVQLRFLPNSRVLDGSDLPPDELAKYKADSKAWDQMVADNNAALESIVKLAGAAGNTILVLEGNVDSSRKAVADEVMSRQVKELSYARAEAVKNSLEKLGISTARMAAKGNGWDKPMPGAIDPNNKEHNRLNRRTDVVIKSIEAD